MILIVGSIDTFVSYVQCLPHIEWSMPCSGILEIKWWFYAIILFIVVILWIISTKRLKKIKKQIENNFIESTTKTQIDKKDIKVEESSTKKVLKKKIVAKKAATKEIWALKTKRPSNKKISTQKKSSK